MQTFQLKSILIPMQIDGSWQTTKLVKALLYPLMNLDFQGVITVILSSLDGDQCESANKAIQNAKREGKWYFSFSSL